MRQRSLVNGANRSSLPRPRTATRPIEDEAEQAVALSLRGGFTLGDWIYVLNEEAANNPARLRRAAMLLKLLQVRLSPATGSRYSGVG
jgi:hypothetical protein